MKVVICVDFSPYTKKVLEAAQVVLGSRMPRPEITVLHVLDMTLLSTGIGNEAQTVQELKERSSGIYAMARKYLGSGIIYREEYGIPQVVIDQALEEAPCDLLVIGTRGRSTLAGIFLGSISEHLLHRAQQPLLIVP